MIYNFGVNKHTIVTVAERLKKRWKYLNEKYQSKKNKPKMNFRPNKHEYYGHFNKYVELA